MKRLFLCLMELVILTASARECKVNITPDGKGSLTSFLPSTEAPLSIVHRPLSKAFSKFKLKDVAALQSDQKQGYQGMCIYEDWLLSVQNKGYATLYKLPALEKKTETFKLGCFGDTNHANVAAFGVEKYDENDPLPLVYVSQAYKNVVNGEKAFKAVAPIAGLTMVWMYRDLEASRPIPLFEIHGTEDRTSEWTGDLENKGGWGAYMPVPMAVGYWVAKNRCTKEETKRVESLNCENGHYVIKHRFTESTTGCDVWLYEVVGGKHTTHTEDLHTGDEIWNFFKKYVK